MADNIIKLKKNSTPGAVPTTSDLQLGELAVNTADGILYIKRTSIGGDYIEKITPGSYSPYTWNDILSGITTTYGNNTISQPYATILGGYSNTNDGPGSTVLNGQNNNVVGSFSLIGGGTNNNIGINGDSSAIIGGDNNFINHKNTFTLGSGLTSESDNFTYTNNISSNATIYDQDGNSNQWNDVYTVVNSTSAENATRDYVYSNFLSLTGGRINGDMTIVGNLTSTGTQTFANTIFTTTSALSVVHFGSGPAMWIGNNGPGDIASFYDIDQNVEILHVGGNNSVFPNVGVKTSTPNKDFTVNGEISASNTIWDANGNSNNWNSVYSSYNTASASLATNPYVNSNFLPLSGGTMTGKLNLFPSTASSVPINLGSGAIPSTTVAGDVFASGNNIFYKGTTGGPYIFAYKNDINTFYLPQIISTVSPTGDNTPALRITQAGGGEALRIEDETNPDSTPFIVNSTGSVGIGLSSLNGVDAKLTVVGNISATGLMYGDGSNLTGIIAGDTVATTLVRTNSANWNSVYSTVNSNSATWGTGADLGIRALSAKWENTYTSVQANSATNWNNSIANNYTHTNFLPITGGTINGNLTANNIHVITDFTAGVGAAVLYVDSFSVGINTESPVEALTVVGNISASGTIMYGVTSTTPVNAVTPVGWADVTVGNVVYKLPLYQ